jgi:hypothetical protein
MSTRTTYVDGAVRTFIEGTAAALDNKENLLVELDAAEETVKLLTTVGNAIGFVRQKLQPGDTAVAIRLLGKGGTVKAVQSAAIAKGARVIEVVGGKIATIPVVAGTYRSLGRKLTQGSGAANDVVEISDLVETIIVP